MSTTRNPIPPTDQAWAWSWLRRRWVHPTPTHRPSESGAATATWTLPR